MKIVQDNKSLKKLCKTLVKQKIIYIDTEFLRDRTYWPLLCTIQIKAQRTTYLVDIISNPNMDFSDLKIILKNKKIIKVIHSSKQDIEVILHKFNLMVSPVFDTQIAYDMISAEKNISYTRLVCNLFKIKLSKEYQRSNWMQRPLSLSQIEYAKNDVKYLPKIYRIILAQIQKKRLVKKLHRSLKNLESIKDVYSLKLSYKRIKVNKISKEELKLLKIFCQWREKKAQYYNLPRNWIISDKLLIQASKKRYCNIKKKKAKNKNINSKIEEFKSYLKSEKFI